VQDGFPGIRLVLLHSLSHALMRQIVLDCGYTAASVRERLYSRKPEEEGGPMAGILLYTAAPDSEGTLGGLVELGVPQTLGRHRRWRALIAEKLRWDSDCVIRGCRHRDLRGCPSGWSIDDPSHRFIETRALSAKAVGHMRRVFVAEGNPADD
jgi:hypothetical protein